jgi:ABC-type transport system involved in cytochrome bd biosynthesis fused ATPase/permease subunit
LSDFVDISVMLKFVAFLILAYILSLNVSRGMIFMYHVPWCVFFQYLAQRKKQETEEKRLKQKKAREEFLVMLEVCPSCLLLLLMLFFLVVTEETEKQDFKNQTS